ncbi:MAG: methyltransferase domain-containing protein [Acidimicrobiia bacterium]|nr:methyltransferase domain-containing protein [Acidimicrobiia bacterium]
MQLHQDPVVGDAFGAALLAELHQAPADDFHYVERSDGFLGHLATAAYFRDETDWPAIDLACLERLRGRVLDIGAGAGRVARAAQHRDLEVTALDVSAGAIEVCRSRGVAGVFHGTIEDLARSPGRPSFETFVMMGNNVGLLGGPERSEEVFGVLAALGSDTAQIIGTAGHVYKTDDPDHLRYHELNRSLGRMAGELRLRTRYRSLTTDWFDYLFASPEELAELANRAGWELVDTVEDEGFIYMVELHRRG